MVNKRLHQIKDHQHSMKEAELEFDNRYQAAQSEMAKTFAMTLETGSVCCWMVATMIELEASLYKPPAPWPVQELKRILAVWKLLGERCVFRGLEPASVFHNCVAPCIPGPCACTRCS